MKRQDILNILFTFVIGVVVGVYVFFAGFAPTADRIETAVEDIGQSLVVTGEAYGGCDRAGACPSFNIANNGDYRYVFTPRGANEAVLLEGTLPLDIQRQMKRSLQPDVLRQFSVSIDPIMCDSYVDGIDVRYIIELNDEMYEVDSCGTAVDGDSVAWETLGGLWYYFELSDR
jgi:hypothetical protein